MSGGEQQMLAIARGLMAEPRLIILDEPSLGLMPIVTQEVFRLIEAVNKSGIGVLLVEQNLHQSLRIAHRGYVLEKGSVVLAGTGKELLADAYVQRAFLGAGSARRRRAFRGRPRSPCGSSPPRAAAPSAIRRPASSTSIRSETSMTDGMSCSTSTTVTPLPRIWRNTSIIAAVSVGLRPAHGSSASSRSARVAMARATSR